MNHTNLLHLYLGTESRETGLSCHASFPKFCQQHIGKMEEKSIWKFIKDVSSGLAYLHSLNPPIIHQDIKPDNILISKDGDYLITDFGISKQLRSTLKKSANHLNSAGAVSYMGPERFSKQYQAVKASDYGLWSNSFRAASGELRPVEWEVACLTMVRNRISGRILSKIMYVVASCLAKETWEARQKAIEYYAQLSLRTES